MEVIINKVIIYGDTKCSFLSSPTRAKEIIGFVQLLLSELDFSERETDVPYSYQDKIFLRKIQEGIQQKGRELRVALPLMDDEVKLPNSKKVGIVQGEETRES